LHARNEPQKKGNILPGNRTSAALPVQVRPLFNIGHLKCHRLTAAVPKHDRHRRRPRQPSSSAEPPTASPAQHCSIDAPETFSKAKSIAASVEQMPQHFQPDKKP
jgi:hypothetical protein